MNHLTLILANLMRKPTRTVLTFLTLVVAFLLFMLLRAVAEAFAGGITIEGVQRLHVGAKYSMTDSLPFAHIRAIREQPGVAAASTVVWFGGYYQDPRNSFAKLVIDPNDYFEAMPEVQVSDAVLKRFRQSRQSVIVADVLARKYGWRIGDAIPIRGEIWPKSDGAWGWGFLYAGSYTAQTGSSIQPAMLIQHEYFSESAISWAANQFTWAVVRLDDGVAPKAVIDGIDQLFENSPDPTKSVSEDDYRRQFANQLGDMGAITTLILVAVFFTILLLTANVTSLSFRERVPELAVLKTLGFEDRYVSRLVLAEAIALCGLGALGGIALGFAIEPALNAQLGEVLGSFHMRWSDALTGLAIGVAMGVVIGVPSARAARKLSIIAALREAH